MTERTDLLARLTIMAATLPSPDGLPSRLCEAARVIADADGASLALSVRRADSQELDRVVLWATDEAASRIEEIHDVLGSGPALDAVRDDTAVVVHTSTAERTAWSVFAEMVGRKTDAVHITALPMHVGSAVLGVLLLYRSRPGELAETLDDLGFLADAIAAAVLQDVLEREDGAPEQTWGERSTVNQAVGMVMAQLAVPSTDALALLRAHAFALDSTLDEVAARVLRRDLTFRPEEAP